MTTPRRRDLSARLSLVAWSSGSVVHGGGPGNDEMGFTTGGATAALQLVSPSLLLLPALGAAEMHIAADETVKASHTADLLPSQADAALW